MITPSISWTLITQLAAVAGGSFVVSVALIVALWPLFERYWVTNPSTRSSHYKPTPQGGGIGVIAATFISAAVMLALGAPATHPGLSLLGRPWGSPSSARSTTCARLRRCRGSLQRWRPP